ncbi:hypothetical protein E3P99_03705 [Wallemia hederae]|uniref:Uncharacterized protein n=1 Tax=Wallemia hederae TaxID=1540922 RepID=A0A4T0FEL2_9BASI|nr:hypothetical protein E3P99_03705 [Wallemia hederae]
MKRISQNSNGTCKVDATCVSKHSKAPATAYTKERAYASLEFSSQRISPRTQKTMDSLLEGVAHNALSVLQNAPGIEDEDAIPTCVLVSHEPSSNLVILRRLSQLTQHTNLLTLQLGWQDFGSTPSLQNGIKSIVTGLLSEYADDSVYRQYITNALSSTDFNTVYRWYKDTHMDGIQGNNNDSQTLPNIVITLRDFEALPTPLVQDLVSLLAHYRKYIPISLVLCIDSSPAAVYRLLPRYTIIQLAMTQVAAPSANTTFEAIIGELFFSTSYNPPVILNGPAFDVLFDTFNHSQNSFEHLLHTLDFQLLEHFFQPHSIFFDTDALTAESIKDHRAWRYLLSLPSTISYLHHGQVDEQLCKTLLAEEVNSVEGLESLKKLYKVFKKDFNLGNDAFRSLQNLRNFIHSVVPDSKDFVPNAKALMQAKMHGELAKAVDKAVQSIGLMSKVQLFEWLSGFDSSSSGSGGGDGGHKSMQIASEHMASFREMFMNGDEITLLANEQTTRDANFVEYAQKCADEWLNFFVTHLVEERLVPFEEIWKLSVSADLQMLVNPSPRHAMLTALRYPQKLLSQYYGDVQADAAMESNVAPDTCLVFKCYTEAGRVLNLADWFTAFKSILENADANATGNRSSKSKKRKTKDDDDDETMLQARFTQAVNELDSMGFIKKASARNRNIVARTVFLHVEGDDDEPGELETIEE